MKKRPEKGRERASNTKVPEKGLRERTRKETLQRERTYVMCAVHCVLCTVYYVVYSVYCVLYTVYCMPCAVYCMLCTVYCIVFTLFCALSTVSRRCCFEEAVFFYAPACRRKPPVKRLPFGKIKFTHCPNEKGCPRKGEKRPEK